MNGVLGFALVIAVLFVVACIVQYLETRDGEKRRKAWEEAHKDEPGGGYESYRGDG